MPKFIFYWRDIVFSLPLDAVVIGLVTKESSENPSEDPFNIKYVVKIVQKQSIESETMIRCIQQPVLNMLFSNDCFQPESSLSSYFISYMRDTD